MVSKTCLVIDSHVHPPSSHDAEDVMAGVSAIERMLEAGRRAGIDKQVFLGRVDDLALRAAFERFPDQVIPFLRVSCIDPDAPATLERYVTEHGYRGAKIHQETRLWPLTGILGAYPLFLKAAQLGVPVVAHTWHEEEGLERDVPAITETGSLPVSLFEELGRRFPQTTFILAHVGGSWVKAFQAAQPYPNLYFDVSGTDPERGIVENAVAVLGAERILYGSDAPFRNYAAQIAKVMYADITEPERRLLLGGNIMRLLDLQEGS